MTHNFAYHEKDRRRSGRIGRAVPLFLALLVAFGCAESVGVRKVDIHTRFEQMDRSALNSSEPSERTLLFLRRHDLEKAWHRDAKAVIAELDRGLRQSNDREALFAIMELSFIEGRREAGRPGTAVYNLSCAVYAYSYLFDPGFGPPADPYNPRSRDACDFYNRSFAAFVIYLRDNGIRATPETPFALVGGELSVVERSSELRWAPGEFDTFFVTYEFEVEGLEKHYQTSGLGVPLILIRTPAGNEVGDREERFLPKLKQTYAATGFLRVSPFLSQLPENATAFEGEFQIFDPVNSERFGVGDRSAPIEADFTTPLAYLTGTSKIPAGINGVLDVASWKDLQGLYMLQPYQRGKIPVIFVHGLMSSPRTWLAMFNDLNGDPVLRKHYQFWFFMYPTGNPIMYSAAILRDSLNEVRRFFDPDGNDPAFEEMVLVGHSMGGVISRYMIIDSGDRFWKAITDTPFDKADLGPEQREIARRVFFFEHLPYVSRVIFIATPHRGSDMADHRIGRLGSSLVELPLEIVKTSLGLFKNVVTKPLAIASEGDLAYKIDHPPTGIDALSPGNQMYAVLNEIPVRSELPYHSIIGNAEAGDTPGGTDGVVPYESSHLEGAASEKIVLSGHSAHNHPLAILEVHRILMMHLEKLGIISDSRSPIIQ